MSFDHDYEPGALGVCRRCGEEKHGPAGSGREPAAQESQHAPQRFSILVVWKNGDEEYLVRGLCAHGPVALFQSRESAEDQRAFLLEGIADEVQSINVVSAPSY